MFVPGDVSGMVNMTTVDLTLDNILLEFEGEYNNLQQSNEYKTWMNFKSAGHSQVHNKRYDTDNYAMVLSHRSG